MKIIVSFHFTKKKRKKLTLLKYNKIIVKTGDKKK